MSKKWLIIPAAILAAGAGATGVFANARVAENPVNTVKLSETLNGNSRVDKAQGDFVNASENPNGGFVDRNNDGVCDNYANGAGNGCGRGNSGFVDSDNDGVCDNYANGTGNGCGRGNGHHSRGGANGCRRRGGAV